MAISLLDTRDALIGLSEAVGHRLAGHGRLSGAVMHLRDAIIAARSGDDARAESLLATTDRQLHAAEAAHALA
jgi:hypothetical protein